MRRFICSAFVLGLAATASWAQTGAARGRVIDSDGQPLLDVNILIEFKGGVTRNYDAKTNKKGEFTRVGMPPGVYRFTASKDGYRPIYIEAKVNLGDATFIGEFKLEKVAGPAAGGGDPGIAELKATFEKAVLASQEGRYDEAEALYKEALAKHPEVYQIHHNLGVLYASKKDFASAEAAYRKAIELRADYVDAYVGLSNLYLSANQTAKARELLDKLVAERPDDAKLQFQLGVVLFNSGQSDAAFPIFTKVAEIDPSNNEVHFFLGSILIGMGKTTECIAELEKYLAGPTSPQNKATAEGLVAALKPKK